MLVLVAIVLGAAWCVDGCPDPTDRSLPSSGTSFACLCVAPFATAPRFSLPQQPIEFRRLVEVTIVHLWTAPTLSIDHPPRFI